MSNESRLPTIGFPEQNAGMREAAEAHLQRSRQMNSTGVVDARRHLDGAEAHGMERYARRLQQNNTARGISGTEE